MSDSYHVELPLHQRADPATVKRTWNRPIIDLVVHLAIARLSETLVRLVVYRLDPAHGFEFPKPSLKSALFPHYSLRKATAGSIREALQAGAYPAASAAANRIPMAAATANESLAFTP